MADPGARAYNEVRVQDQGLRSSEYGNFLSIFIQETNEMMAEVIVVG